MTERATCWSLRQVNDNIIKYLYKIPITADNISKYYGRRGVVMGDNKNKSFSKDDKKGKPAATNDQLGENAAEGRILKDAGKNGKCR